MVCSGAGKMEMGTTSGGGRSLKAPLHNFNLPSFLKWGHQRQLRCKLPKKRAAPAPEEEGIDAVREKIMFDLKTAAERMKVAMFREGVSDDEEEEDDKVTLEPEPEPKRGKVVSAAAEEEGRRWNLRTRKGRNVSAAPAVSAGVSSSAGGYRSSSPIVKGERGEEKKREFSVALSRKEIEEDLMAMVGHRPARRPKKRHKTVQRQLDTIFPGLWLSEVTADMYKVPEVPDTGKR